MGMKRIRSTDRTKDATRFKDRLQYGDLAIIAKIAGVSHNTAIKTLSMGIRYNKAVQEVAEEFLDNRDKLTRKFKQKA